MHYLVSRSGVGRRLVAVAVACSALAACGTTVTTPPSAQGPAGTALPGQPIDDGLSAGVPGSTTPGSAPAPGSGPGAAPVTAPGTSAGGQSGQSSGGGTASARQGGAAASIPSRGRGWDDKRVYIGVPWQDTAASQSTAGALGLEGLVGGDYREIARAVIADINKRGGLFGRAVEPVFVEFPPLPNQNGQSQCTAWTQDRPVFAVSDSFYDADPLAACLARAKMPFNRGTVGPMEDKTLAKYAPYFNILHTASYNRLFPVLLDRLQARGFLTGWDTTLAAPGNGPIKAGVYCRDDNEPQRNDCALMQQVLTARGIAVAPTFHVSGYNDQSAAAVLRFRSDGVTHVFGDTTDMIFFMTNAQNQGYYPRYGITTYNAPSVLAATAPAEQNRNAAGVSFSTTIDVYPSVASGPGRTRCLRAMKAANVSIGAAGTAEYQVQAICDQINFYVEAAKAGGGLTPDRVVAGIAAMAGTFSSGNVFAFGVSGTRRDGAAAVRDLGWVEGCSCYRYLGSASYPS